MVELVARSSVSRPSRPPSGARPRSARTTRSCWGSNTSQVACETPPVLLSRTPHNSDRRAQERRRARQRRRARPRGTRLVCGDPYAPRSAPAGCRRSMPMLPAAARTSLATARQDSKALLAYCTIPWQTPSPSSTTPSQRARTERNQRRHLSLA
jgi:hypothetical protein